jgi:hypothetical protein
MWWLLALIWFPPAAFLLLDVVYLWAAPGAVVAIAVLAYLAGSVAICVAVVAGLARRFWLRSIVGIALAFLSATTGLYTMRAAISPWSARAHRLWAAPFVDRVRGLERAAERTKEREGVITDEPLLVEVLAALRARQGEEAADTTALPSLARLKAEAPDDLQRFLEASPAWRVSGRGRPIATRRWRLGPNWHSTVLGTISGSDFEDHASGPMESFALKIEIDLAAPEMGQLPPGERCTQVTDSERHCLSWQSYLVRIGDLQVELESFHPLGAKELRVAAAALRALEREFAPVAQKQGWESIRAALAPPGARRGAPSLELRERYQPGDYSYELWVNPGEPGRIRLAAIDSRSGASLADIEPLENSSERIGWSSEPTETFLGDGQFRLDQGFWGTLYSTRLEVWFTPDSGGPERKVLEKLFALEGSQQYPQETGNATALE